MIKHNILGNMQNITIMELGNSLPIIASGGIFKGADAQSKMDAGANLVQIWTGFIYEGPGMVKNICTHLSNHK